VTAVTVFAHFLAVQIAATFRRRQSGRSDELILSTPCSAGETRFWLNLQTAYELAVVEAKLGEIASEVSPAAA
jgi:hypothetical protein